jgi:RHS repeat-associated protein
MAPLNKSETTDDSNGNTLTKTVGTDTTSYTWDFENRLASVTLPSSGGTVTFKYDPYGRRVYKSSSAATSVFAYDGDNLIEEANSSGTVVTRYAQTQNIDEPLAMLHSGGTSYYNADGLGSITSLTNSSGAAAETYTYDSFGKVTATSGALTNPFQYTGRELDSETGLYNYRARYYDASVGRFIAEDPILWFGNDVNFYRYAANRPSIFIDPFGRTVYLCHRPVNLVGFFSFLNGYPSLFSHFWIKTNSVEAGLGNANVGVPGQNAPPDLPLTKTVIVNHQGESTAPGATCSEVPDEDEDCVNKELQIGKSEGRFIPGINDCRTFANSVLNACSKFAMPPYIPMD